MATSGPAPTTDDDLSSWSFEAIGTSWTVDVDRPAGPAVRRAVADRVEAFDRDWSRFRPGSVVDALRAGAGRHRLPDDAAPLIEVYDALHRLTAGAVSPAVGGSLEHLGYDAAYSLRPGPGHVPAPDWGAVRWEPPYLVTSEPLVLDVGAAGKGYLADLVAAVVREHTDGAGVTVDASGDLVHRPGPGASPLRVALEHPRKPGYAVGVVSLDGSPGARALCASATNRRTWADGVHHVLDARTGAPTGDVLATWVVADDARTADAVATALFLAPPETLRRELDFTWVTYDARGALRASPDLAGELFR